MIRRNLFITCMEMLAILREGPKSRSRLAQASNINYARLDEFLAPLKEKGYVQEEQIEMQAIISLTVEGLKYHEEWEMFWNRFQSGVKGK